MWSRGQIVNAIRQAGASAGVDFSYLLNKASQESGLDSDAKAKGSSATGLFQFIEQTWLRMVKTHGEKYGLGEAASKITVNDAGTAKISDASTRQQILALRNDPRISACMAAEFTRDNKSALEGKLDSKVGATELYLAHFLGADGAAKFLGAMQKNPSAAAADVLPKAAAANPAVFYGRNGTAVSLEKVYARFAAKFDNDCGSVSVASAAPAINNRRSASVASLDVAESLLSPRYDNTTASDVAYNHPTATSVTAAISAYSQPISHFTTMLLAQMDMESTVMWGARDRDDGQHTKRL